MCIEGGRAHTTPPVTPRTASATRPPRIPCCVGSVAVSLHASAYSGLLGSQGTQITAVCQRPPGGWPKTNFSLGLRYETGQPGCVVRGGFNVSVNVQDPPALSVTPLFWNDAGLLCAPFYNNIRFKIGSDMAQPITVALTSNATSFVCSASTGQGGCEQLACTRVFQAPPVRPPNFQCVHAHRYMYAHKRLHFFSPH